VHLDNITGFAALLAGMYAAIGALGRKHSVLLDYDEPIDTGSNAATGRGRNRPHQQPPLTRRLLVGWRLPLVAGAVATMFGLLIAVTTKIGPILVIFAPERGVHLGDVAGFAVSYLAAFGIVRWIRR
jgi:hypothetical protein